MDVHFCLRETSFHFIMIPNQLVNNKSNRENVSLPVNLNFH